MKYVCMWEHEFRETYQNNPELRHYLRIKTSLTDWIHKRVFSVVGPTPDNSIIERKRLNKSSMSSSLHYRPPSSTAEWSEIFSRQIEKSLDFTDEIYLMRDFNIDIINRNLCNTKWKHVVEINLHKLIKESTRITAHSSTIIDHLYTSKPDLVMDLLVPNIGVSDHFPIQFTRVTGKSHTKRNFPNTI